MTEEQKEAKKLKDKEYREKNKEKIKAWREANKEKLKEYQKKYYEENEEELKKYQKRRREENPEYDRQKSMEYRKNNLEKLREYDRQRRTEGKKKESDKKYREKNKEKLSEQKAEWARKNKDHINNKRKEYLRNNLMPRIHNRLSTTIRENLKKHFINKNNRSWESLVGYTTEELIAHLESLFKEGMTWDNYGSYWHIDHIRPKSWFLFESTEDQAFKDCWALSNLQPLEATENLRKNNRYEG